MFRQLKKNLVATLIAAMTIGQVAPAFADSADTLPDMGTSAGSTLSIGQEMQMGDYYVRQLRGSAPLINDPLLTQYINSLGMRLVSHANSVKTPFHFFLINNDEINAFAFFGGNVVLHSALFRYSDNESQLASVMAHPTSPGASDGRSAAQRAADLGRRVRFYFTGDGQSAGGDGGADRYTGGNASGDDQFHPAK